MTTGNKKYNNRKPKDNSISTEMGKVPPQARELEEAVLGALMLEKDAYSQVSDILKPESFYDPIHQTVYKAVVTLAIQQEPVDILTVVEQLKKQGELDAVGGPIYNSIFI